MLNTAISVLLWINAPAKITAPKRVSCMKTASYKNAHNLITDLTIAHYKAFCINMAATTDNNSFHSYNILEMYLVKSAGTYLAVCVVQRIPQRTERFTPQRTEHDWVLIQYSAIK